jgi:hypothetical protein
MVPSRSADVYSELPEWEASEVHGILLSNRGATLGVTRNLFLPNLLQLSMQNPGNQIGAGKKFPLRAGME